LLAVGMATPQLRGQEQDFDVYKLRINGYWFHSNPSGNFQSAGQRGFGLVDINKDLDFSSFDSFVGKVDWKFTRKNHLYFGASPLTQSNQTVLNRTIVFQGQTFDVGLTTKAELRSNVYALGYQYDIIRRRRGHLGVALQINLLDSQAKISAVAQTAGGMQQVARSASASLLAPIPIAGPEFRLYLTNSPRLYVEGNVFGMYLFGYGNYVSSAGVLGLTLSKHLSMKGGYQLGSRLEVKSNTTDRIGLRLTQVGSIVGLELSF
jgi:hypothetical protein